MKQQGTAAVEYLAIVGVIGIALAGLLTLRPHRAPRSAPVDVIPPIVRLLGRPVDNLAPKPARPRPDPVSRPAPRPRPARRPPDPPLTIPLPDWWGGR